MEYALVGVLILFGLLVICIHGLVVKARKKQVAVLRTPTPEEQRFIDEDIDRQEIVDTFRRVRIALDEHNGTTPSWRR